MQRLSTPLRIHHSRISNLCQSSFRGILKRVGHGGKSGVSLLSEDNTATICSLILQLLGTCPHWSHFCISIGQGSPEKQNWYSNQCLYKNGFVVVIVLAPVRYQYWQLAPLRYIYLSISICSSKGIYFKWLACMIKEADKPQTLKLASQRPRSDDVYFQPESQQARDTRTSVSVPVSPEKMDVPGRAEFSLTQLVFVLFLSSIDWIILYLKLISSRKMFTDTPRTIFSQTSRHPVAPSSWDIKLAIIVEP